MVSITNQGDYRSTWLTIFGRDLSESDLQKLGQNQESTGHRHQRPRNHATLLQIDIIEIETGFEILGKSVKKWEANKKNHFFVWFQPLFLC